MKNAKSTLVSVYVCSDSIARVRRCSEMSNEFFATALRNVNFFMHRLSYA